MTIACHSVGSGCTVMGVDEGCGAMWTALAGFAVMGSPSFGVMVASPWKVSRGWWRSAGSVQVSVGSVIHWRRMAWSPGVIFSNPSVPLWTAHSRGKFRYSLLSELVRCCVGSSILVMGCVMGSWWGHSSVAGGGGAWGISSSGRCGVFASWSPALIVARMLWRVGELGGVWSRIAPGEVVTRQALGVL